jgi:hypothetical protein
MYVEECLKFSLKSTHRFRRSCGFENGTPSSLTYKFHLNKGKAKKLKIIKYKCIKYEVHICNICKRMSEVFIEIQDKV